MRNFLLFIIFTLYAISSGMAQKLSSEAKIALLTCNPGEELYSLFGHSAIRITDTTKDIDIVFNYGTFDFNDPNFYTKFAKGRLKYMLSAWDFQDFIDGYYTQKRSVYSQELLISLKQKQQLYDALINNYRSENRYYKYDFFMDNCATRIDEIIRNSIKGVWKDSSQNTHMTLTYRQGIAPLLHKSPWINIGLNIILGTPTDNKQQGLFLPYILMDDYINKTLDKERVIGDTKILYDAKYKYKTTHYLLRPACVFGLLSIFLFFGMLFFPKKFCFIDFLVFFATGITGCIVFFMWFGSDHIATNDNWNIIWALPTHLLMSFFTFRRKRISRFIQIYFLISAILIGITLACSTYPYLFKTFTNIPYAFPFSSLIPILLCVLFSAIRIVRRNI